MNILIADDFPEEHISSLKALGHKVHLKPDLNASTLPSHISGFQILVVRSTQVTAETVKQADELKLIIRAGAGTNSIDKLSAREENISVCNVPGANSIAVAELTLGLLLAIDRNIPDNVIDLKNGKWNKKKYAKTLGLFGRKMAIIGLGAIGFEVAKRAQAFGVSVFTENKKDRDENKTQKIKNAGIALCESQDELLSICDIVSIHLPSTKNTKECIDQSFFEKMQDNAIFINTSRGDLVNEESLLSALDNKKIRAGLDVFQQEPSSSTADFHSKIAQHPQVYGTHHIGASTSQAQKAVAIGTLAIIEKFQNTGETLYCVN